MNLDILLRFKWAIFLTIFSLHCVTLFTLSGSRGHKRVKNEFKSGTYNTSKILIYKELLTFLWWKFDRGRPKRYFINVEFMKCRNWGVYFGATVF